MSDQDWMVVGTRVFIIARSGISLSTITKVTATQLVTEKDSRYSKKTLSRKLNDWESLRIRPLTDPDTLAQFKAQQVSRLAANVALAASKFKTDPSETTASLVEAALEKWRRAATQA